jgi:hypothetical protein
MVIDDCESYIIGKNLNRGYNNCRVTIIDIEENYGHKS